ncbi:hypothetical protein RRF57_009915 [Xylaria bambusicola]|uniref:Uncharacterized protein n=1 Tax=Xylaria bambusicola TaxID=326684 RepID=A0AAN7UWF5_9PEZI
MTPSTPLPEDPLLPVGPPASSSPIPLLEPCSRLAVVATTAFTLVATVLSYVSRLAMEPISSPVRVSNTIIAASEKLTTKASPVADRGVIQVGEALEPSDLRIS